MKKRRIHNQSRILIILLFLSLSQNISDVAAADFHIAASEEDVLIYRINLDGNISYAKFVINGTVENVSAIVIKYNTYIADSISQFNDTDVEYTNNTLSGNITEDLFGSMTVLNMILPVGTNFTEAQGDLRNSFEEMEGIEIELSTSIYGYAIKLEFFLRIILLVKIVEFTYYYSTTGILLLGHTYFKDPRSGDESYGIFEILPDLSTVSGADEDPLHPDLYVEAENQTTTGTFVDDNQGLKIDVQGVLTIVLGSGAIGGVITAGILLLKKRKKRIGKGQP
jgi:hypothetical protein